MRRLLTAVATVGLLVGTVALAASSTASAAVPTKKTTPGCTVASQSDLTRVDLTVDGKPRSALVHVPVGWDGKSAIPVVLSFHGLGASAEIQQGTDGFVATADQAAAKDKFIVVYPQAGGTLGSLGSAWDLKGRGDVRFVNALIDDLEQRECIDPTRVYATGLSYGGGVTDLLACDLSDRIAAAAPVSAYLPKRACKPTRPVPMLSLHGVEDHLLPYAGGGRSGQRPFERWGADWAKRNGCKGRPTERQYRPTVEQLRYQGCKAPVVLYRVHHNGHTWPGHPLVGDRQSLIDYFSGKLTGKPFPLMVALGLTPEDFADTITLANQDIDASAMILKFFAAHHLAQAPKR